MVKRILTIDFTVAELSALLEHYRVSHHGGRCGKSIKTCHSAKKKILAAIKQEFGEDKYI